MSEIFKFQEDTIDRKDIKVGFYLKIVENDGTVKFTCVTDVGAVKTGKHGSAKTTVEAKDVNTGNSRNLILVANDRATIVKMVKVNVKLFDFIDDTMSIRDDKNNCIEINVKDSMSAEDKAKISEVVSANEAADEFDLTIRALPGYYKLDSIRPVFN